MATFQRLSANVTGKYSEAVVLAAFLAEGTNVSLPFGNQAGWDLLIKEPSGWKEVQIKTAKSFRHGRVACGLLRSSSAKARSTRSCRTYTESDCDLIVVVLPEDGRIWKVPIAAAARRSSVAMCDEWLWVGEPSGIRHIPVSPNHKGRPRTSTARRLLESTTLPESRPSRIRDTTWAMLQEYASGESFVGLSQKYGIDKSCVRDRVNSAMITITSRLATTTPSLPFNL